MGLITVHHDKFSSATPPKSESKPKVRKIGNTDELIIHHADVFSKQLGTLLGTVHLQVDENAKRVPYATGTHGPERGIQGRARPPREAGCTSESR